MKTGGTQKKRILATRSELPRAGATSAQAASAAPGGGSGTRRTKRVQRGAQPAEALGAAIEQLDTALAGELKPLERARLTSVRIRAVEALAKAEPDEARILGTAAWRRILDAVVTAIATLPEEQRVPVRQAITTELDKLTGDA